MSIKNNIISYIISPYCQSDYSTSYRINTNDCQLTDIILIDNGQLSFVEIMVGPTIMYKIDQNDICSYFDFMQTPNRKVDTYILRQKYLETLQNLGEICLNLRTKYNNPNMNHGLQLKCVVIQPHD